MKKYLLISLGMVLCVLTYAQRTNEIILRPEIRKVKLFLTSGQIYHQQDVKVVKGRNKIIFTGISAYANPQSIQFTSQDAYRLISVSTEMDFLAAEVMNPRIARLRDSLETCKDEIQLNKDTQDAFQAELAVLNTNRDLKGANQNLTVAQIREAADFYRTRTLEINKQISKLNKDRQRLEIKLDQVRYQLTELNFNENQRSNQVIVLLDAEQAGTMKTNLDYLVSDCGWAAMYDLSAEDINQKINLKYKAKVYNNTGNDWQQVKLVLSTADPILSATQPRLDPWYVDISVQHKNSKRGYAPQAVQQDYREQAQNDINMANQRAWDSYMLDRNERGDNDKYLSEIMNKRKPNLVIEEVNLSELAAEFEIAEPFNCLSDAKPYVVEVKTMNLDATFSYVSIPKLDPGAFLLANIVGWQDLDLVPGPTNVYFGGNYVGISSIDTREVSDTLSLSFGRDAKVTVLRKLKAEMSSKKVVGNSIREAYDYEIAIRNNRNVPIRISVYDQVPLSRNSEITIASENYEGGVKTPETGEVVWDFTLQATEVKTLNIGYTVKYPKTAKVTMQRYRTTQHPRWL